MSRSSRPRGARLLVLTAATVAVAGTGLCAAPLATAAPTAVPAATTVTGGGFVPVAAQRVLDTRSGLGLAAKGKLGPNATLTSSMVNRNGLPAAGVASAVILNLTSANSTAGSYLTAYPADATTRPTTSSLNFPGGVTIANTVVVPIHSDGKIAVYNALGSTDVVADVVGYYAAADNASYGGLTPLVPSERLYDSRDGDGPFVTGDGVDVPLDFGNATTNASVTGFVLNVTAVSPTGTGYFTAWDGSGSKPGVSALNFRKGVTAANLVEVKSGAYANPSGGADLPGFRIEATTFGGASGLAIDIAGYYTKPSVGNDSRFVPLDTPQRIVDTRDAQSPNLLPKAKRSFSAPIGDSSTGMLMTNLTVAGSTAPTYVSVFPTGSDVPGTSNINANKGAVVANAAVVVEANLGNPGSFDAYNAAGTTPFLVDVSGYFEVLNPAAVAARTTKASAPVVHAVRY